MCHAVQGTTAQARARRPTSRTSASRTTLAAGTLPQHAAATWRAGSSTRRSIKPGVNMPPRPLPGDDLDALRRLPGEPANERRRRDAAAPRAATTVPPTATQARALERTWRDPPGCSAGSAPINHKTIGKRFIVTAFGFFVAGGLLAALMRLQLARPENTLIGPDLYNQLFTMHGTTMMFLFAVPVMQAMAVYLVPLMVGTRSVAFPRMNALRVLDLPVRRADAVRRVRRSTSGPTPAGSPTCRSPGPQYSPGKRVDFWAQMITFTEVSGLLEAVDRDHHGLQAARAGHDARTACRCSSGRCW